MIFVNFMFTNFYTTMRFSILLAGDANDYFFGLGGDARPTVFDTNN